MSASPDPDDYDSPWKEAVENQFPEFMAFYFPAAHAAIDWSKEHVFLDTELQAVVQDAELGRRMVDKLVRVTGLDGSEDTLYVHIEVQSLAQKSEVLAMKLKSSPARSGSAGTSSAHSKLTGRRQEGF